MAMFSGVENCWRTPPAERDVLASRVARVALDRARCGGPATRRRCSGNRRPRCRRCRRRRSRHLRVSTLHPAVAACIACESGGTVGLCQAQARPTAWRAARPLPSLDRQPAGGCSPCKSAHDAACSTCRAPTPARWRRPSRSPPTRLILDLEDAVAPEAKETARDQVCDGRQGRRLRPARADHPHQRARHALGRGRPRRRGGRGARRDPAAQARPPAPTSCAPREALASAGAPDKTRLWAMIETPLAILNVARDRRRSARSRARGSPASCMGTNDLVKETRADLLGQPPPGAVLAVGHRHGRARLRPRRARRRLQRLQGRRRLPRANACTAARSASTARR